MKIKKMTRTAAKKALHKMAKNLEKNYVYQEVQYKYFCNREEKICVVYIDGYKHFSGETWEDAIRKLREYIIDIETRKLF